MKTFRTDRQTTFESKIDGRIFWMRIKSVKTVEEGYVVMPIESVTRMQTLYHTRLCTRDTPTLISIFIADRVSCMHRMYDDIYLGSNTSRTHAYLRLIWKQKQSGVITVLFVSYGSTQIGFHTWETVNSCMNFRGVWLALSQISSFQEKRTSDNTVDTKFEGYRVN